MKISVILHENLFIERLAKKVLLGKSLSSPAGNRTPVSRVTGGDTYHYTTEDDHLSVITLFRG